MLRNNTRFNRLKETRHLQLTRIYCETIKIYNESNVTFTNGACECIIASKQMNKYKMQLNIPGM